MVEYDKHSGLYYFNIVNIDVDRIIITYICVLYELCMYAFSLCMFAIHMYTHACVGSASL